MIASEIGHNAGQLYVANYGQTQQTIVDPSGVINSNYCTNTAAMCNGDVKSIINIPSSVQPVQVSGQQYVPPQCQANAPSPSAIFNSPSPAVATSVLSPAVPSPSQSAAIAALPQANSPNLISQLTVGSQIQIATQPNNSAQQVLQIITPVAAQPRLPAVVRPKHLQILPKPPAGASQVNNAAVAKSMPIGLYCR